jgi:hypothetical protein
VKKPPIEELLAVKPDEIEGKDVLQPISSEAEIQNRLTNLRASDNEIENDNVDQNIDDIQKRLAILKGIEYKPQEGNKVLFVKDTRSNQEQIEDLLKQFVEEKNINDAHAEPTKNELSDDRTNTVEDIEKRLAALRGVDISKIKNDVYDRSDETEREEIDRTVLQYLEEAKLPDFNLDEDEKEFMNSIPAPPENKEEDFPYCEICDSEKSLIKCFDCENIFCHTCFVEFHDDDDYKGHKTKKVEQPVED